MTWDLKLNSILMKKKTTKFRRLTSKIRSLPDFLIIGTQKAGTSSLAFYLSQYPNIKFSYYKEVHFFDKNYSLGLDWYKSFFPFKLTNRNNVIGEATPFYLFHPHCPLRIKESLPDVKLIVLLRNPIDRAISHFNMQVRYGNEINTNFEEAIMFGDARTEKEMKKTIEDETYNNRALQRFSYLERGKYYKQIENWFNYFNQDQFLILNSEDFFSNPVNTLNEVSVFLGIKPFTPGNLTIQNEGNYKGITDETKKKLTEYYKEDVINLSRLTGINFNWF